MKLHEYSEIDISYNDVILLNQNFSYYCIPLNFQLFDFELLSRLFHEDYQDLYAKELSFSLFVIKTIQNFSFLVDKSNLLPSAARLDRYLKSLLADKSNKATWHYILTLELINFEISSKEVGIYETGHISSGFRMRLENLWSRPSFRPFLIRIRRFCFMDERFAPKISSTHLFNDICSD